MKIWKIALATWLILFGLLAITNVRFEAQNLLMGVLAIGAAVLLLFDR